MSVFITGATGVLGKRLVDRLSDRGYDVIGLARDGEGERTVEQRGGTARRGDVLEPESLEDAVSDGVEVVIHAATAIPDSTKPSDEEWTRNDRVRLDGARNLLDAAPHCLQRMVFPSVVWIARQPDGSRFDETAERHPDRATRSAAEVEDLLRERADFFRIFADLLDAPEPSRIPAWLARFFVGKINAKGFTSPMPTTNEKAKRELDWEPKHPTYEDGLQHVIETWRADGTLAQLNGETPADTQTETGAA